MLCLMKSEILIFNEIVIDTLSFIRIYYNLRYDEGVKEVHLVMLKNICV